MAGAAQPRRVLVAGLRLRVRRGGRPLRATCQLDQLPELLAGGTTFQEVRPGLHDRPHQPQSLHQHQNLGESIDAGVGRCCCACAHSIRVYDEGLLVDNVVVIAECIKL